MIDAAAVAERCLTALVAEHQANDWPLPRECYVAGGSPNEVAVDGEHLAVMLDGLVPGATDASSRAGAIQSRGFRGMGIPRATLVVRLMRCVPVVNDRGRHPSVQEKHESGLALLGDVGRVYTALVRWRDAENGSSFNGPVTVGQVESIGPGGGLAGHLWFVTVAPVS